MANKWSKRENVSSTFFKDIGFNIDIQRNLKEIDFLGVTLKLQNGTYRLYTKPNDKLLYIQSLSNHLPQITKNLPNTNSERLSKNSSNQDFFNIAKVKYEDQLKKSGYNFDSNIPITNQKNQKRESKTYALTHPWANVSTNIAKSFLQLVTKHFPRSYKVTNNCMINM